jgi:hypothetical protein
LAAGEADSETMAHWLLYLRAALRSPPHVTIAKALRLGARIAEQRTLRRRDLCEPTFTARAPDDDLRRRIRLDSLSMSPDDEVFLAQATSLYLDNRFNLLGSGWSQVRHGVNCPGLSGHRFPPGAQVAADGDGRWLFGRINAANLGESQRIWRLIHQPYIPIDWQLDFKSGYRWSELTYFRDVRYGHVLGADVKIPWELARLQHLPQLALAHRLATGGRPGFATPPEYVEAMRNQVVDFIATNPPRFGVNWVCPMDVAIRVVNILVAVDLFIDAGAGFDRPFLALVRRSVAEHAQYVLDNLEWAEANRGNHYFANILGLLFAGAYLPRSPDVDAWFSFAVREFIGEGAGQFFPDGGNSEGSTAYHCLCGEFLSFGMALLLGIDEDEARMLSQPQRRLPVRPPQPAAGLTLHEITPGQFSPLPGALFATLAAAARLTQHATKPSHEIVQWGDNDSARLLKSQPAWTAASSKREEAEAASVSPAEAIVENTLDHRSFVAAAAAVTLQKEQEDWAGRWTEGGIARALAQGRAAPVPRRPLQCDVGESSLEDIVAAIRSLAPESQRAIEIAAPPDVFEGVQRVAYAQFGHYAFLSPRLFLAIRCPRREFGRASGHSHDDLLAVELQVEGRNVLTDPGTFVYTPLPLERNLYRAAEAHGVPRPAKDGRADISRGLFEISAVPGARCLFFGARGFAGQAFGPGWRTMRVVLCEADRILIVDGCPTGPLSPLAAGQNLPLYCRGYGAKTTSSPSSC